MELKEKLQKLPDKTGVYLMKDGQGKIIYVGKALSLRSRVRSYFQKSSSLGAKNQALVKNIKNLDYIVTDSEVEALILESNLIKENRPRYNVLLKDDKHFPYLKITMQEDYPRILIVRKMQKDGARYFGPYTSSSALRETVKLIKKIFPLRHCRKDIPAETKMKDRPCLNFQIQRCLAPCQGQVATQDYKQVATEVVLFMEGKQEHLLKEIKRKMEQSAHSLNFEKAAIFRDQYQAVEKVLERQKIITSDLKDRDIVALARDSGKTVVQAFLVRQGKLVGNEEFSMLNTEAVSLEEVMTSFIKQYYSKAIFIPTEILLSNEVAEKELLENWLTEKRGKNVLLKNPQRGYKKDLVKMASENAKLQIEKEKEELKEDIAYQGQLELAQLLSLGEPPYRIEGYDISNLQETAIVASQVVFTDGKADKAEYRRYKILSTTIPDDYASMQEVIIRRFKSKDTAMPDLVLIDGGKGQLAAARQSLLEVGLADLSIVSLAKKEELIYYSKENVPLKLQRNSPALKLLQQIRDEAHRFAVSYHRKLRSKASFQSTLSTIPGVGPKRRIALLKHFGSIDKIKTAIPEELVKIKEINHKIALSIYNYFNKGQ